MLANIRQFKNIRSTSRHLSYLVASLFPKGSVPEEEKPHRLPFQEFPTVPRVEQLAHQPANTGIERFVRYCQEQIKEGNSSPVILPSLTESFRKEYEHFF